MKDVCRVIVVGHEDDSMVFQIEGKQAARAFAEIVAGYAAIVALEHCDGRREIITKKDDVP